MAQILSKRRQQNSSKSFILRVHDVLMRDNSVQASESPQRVLYPLLKRLGIPKSGMHALRHGRVSYLVECNTPIEAIRAWMGTVATKWSSCIRTCVPNIGNAF